MASKPEITSGVCNEKLGKSQNACMLTVKLPDIAMRLPNVPADEAECQFFGSCVLKQYGISQPE